MGDKLGVTPSLQGDPLGQGRDLLGFGFADRDSARTFIGVDQLDLESMTDRDGTRVKGATIEDYRFKAMRADGAGPRAAADWRDVTVQGRIHCSSPRYVGSTAPVTVRITSVDETRAQDTTARRVVGGVYHVQILIDNKIIEPTCRDAGDTAFPVPGYWDSTGKYIRHRSLFSFACTRRDVATCLALGYRADGDGDGSKLLEACTRMMRADYCGTGRSATNDGSFIAVWDNRGIAREMEIEPLVFEAAWSAKGAVCINRPRWQGSTVACKSKIPRCDALQAASARYAGTPLIFNSSCMSHPCAVVKIENVPRALDGKSAPEPHSTLRSSASRIPVLSHD